MWRKGLLEWKLLAAVFAVLIVGSTALIGDTNIGKAFFNSTESGSGWTNPFGSLFRQPEASGPNAVAIELALENISFGFESPVNITSGRSEMESFAGVAAFDFRDNSSYYAQSGQGMVIRKDIESTQIRGAVLKSIVLESADYVVASGGTNITGKSERIEIHGFSGTVKVSDRVRLEGTVSSVRNGKWSIGGK